ncbi:MAG: polyphosphate polymerase domain-containing protein, partial [Gemmataceae bacterium]
MTTLVSSTTTGSWPARAIFMPARAEPDPAVSPGLAQQEGGPAFELKFQLTMEEAALVEAWARARLQTDPHGVNGCYRTTTVYCDTAQLDVFHRSTGFRRSKYRLRRYGEAGTVHLERKTRKGDHVRKRRCEVPGNEVGLLAQDSSSDDWAGRWFHQRIRTLELRPICRVAYERTAFFGQSGGLPVRLTIDRNLAGTANLDWNISPLAD